MTCPNYYRIMPDRDEKYFIAFRANGANTFHHLGAFEQEGSKENFKNFLLGIGGVPWGDWYNVPNKAAVDAAVDRVQQLGGYSYYMKDDN